MEWIGFIALAVLLCYSSYPGKVKRLEVAVKRLERKQRGENNMSKLVNTECKIKSDDALQLVGSTEMKCLVLDTDDEWMKVRFTDKKNNQITKLLRIENIDELLNKVATYEEVCAAEQKEVSLSGFLEEVALVADIDNLDEEQDYVVLMTLHSAKGLEFPNVYLAGMEDGLFPSYMCIDNPEDLEEERRLCYVGITRAEQELVLSCARMRMVRGETHYNRVSRFVKEIPEDLLEKEEKLFSVKEEKDSAVQTAFKQAKQAFTQKPFTTYASPLMTGAKQFAVTKEKGLDYTIGDRVRHIKFGVGTVKDIVEGGRDYEVTVEFDTAGVKKMFATFAKLKKEVSQKWEKYKSNHSNVFSSLTEAKSPSVFIVL